MPLASRAAPGAGVGTRSGRGKGGRGGKASNHPAHSHSTATDEPPSPPCPALDRSRPSGTAAAAPPPRPPRAHAHARARPRAPPPACRRPTAPGRGAHHSRCAAMGLRAPGAGVAADARARAPWYARDWADGAAARGRLLAPAVFIFLASALPALAFGQQLAGDTGAARGRPRGGGRRGRWAPPPRRASPPPPPRPRRRPAVGRARARLHRRRRRRAGRAGRAAAADRGRGGAHRPHLWIHVSGGPRGRAASPLPPPPRPASGATQLACGLRRARPRPLLSRPTRRHAPAPPPPPARPTSSGTPSRRHSRRWAQPCSCPGPPGSAPGHQRFWRFWRWGTRAPRFRRLRDSAARALACSLPCFSCRWRSRWVAGPC
jgi:hypothetical protein